MKVQIKVYVDEQVRDHLYDFIKGKYESFHGRLSQEVQNAIISWIGQQGLVAHTKTHKINPGIPQTQAKMDQIIGWLRGEGFTNQFTTNAWEQACYNTVGSDHRTVEKYLRLARKLGRVKHYAGAVWEIV